MPNLPKKPLAEAILEIKWVPNDIVLGDPSPRRWTDPSHPLFLGILYEQLKGTFPATEELPAGQVPDVMTPGIVKTRFRTGKNQWPLVQAGPGVLTINFTDSYTWDEFRMTSMDVYTKFLNAYVTAGAGKAPTITATLLRYIDAIEMDEGARKDPRTFVRDMLHVNIDLPKAIAESNAVIGSATTLDVRLSFPLNTPPGVGNLRVATGNKNRTPAIILETAVLSRGDQCPQTGDQLQEWLDASHEIIHSWFFDMIEGTLLDQFSMQE